MVVSYGAQRSTRYLNLNTHIVNKAIRMDETEEIKNGMMYVCHNCHIIFRILVHSHNKTFGPECMSYPNRTYRIKTDRPKAVCPKCKQESPYDIRIESD